MKNKLKENTLKGSVNYRKSISITCIIAAAFFMMTTGCQKNDDVVGVGSNEDNAKRFSVSSNFTMTNLVANTTGYDAAIIDPNLVNAWGIAFSPSFGSVWISAAETHLSPVYDKDGNTLIPAVSIPFESDGGNPTGQVFNYTTSFVIPSTSEVSRFIFVTENGTIAAWASGNTAITVADRSSQEAVYKGVEIVNSSGGWYLYATDFHNNKVDMFDQNFNFVGNSMFVDASMPAGFAPFNIRKIDDRLYVTYAKQLAPDNEDDEAGPGLGYVNIFNLDGSFVQRFASQGVLNAPWGIEKAKENGGLSPHAETNPHAAHTTILIGNFGDGRINAFDGSGNLLGPLMSNGQPIEIEGLWAISYPPMNSAAFTSVRNRLYFTAGPDEEEHGLFGYITRD